MIPLYRIEQAPLSLIVSGPAYDVRGVKRPKHKVTIHDNAGRTVVITDRVYSKRAACTLAEIIAKAVRDAEEGGA